MSLFPNHAVSFPTIILKEELNMHNSHDVLRRCGVGAPGASRSHDLSWRPTRQTEGKQLVRAAQISGDVSIMSPSLFWQPFTQDALVGDARLQRLNPLVIGLMRSKAKIREHSLKRQERLGSNTSKLLPKQQRTCWIGTTTGAPGTCHLGQTFVALPMAFKYNKTAVS